MGIIPRNVCFSKVNSLLSIISSHSEWVWITYGQLNPNHLYGNAMLIICLKFHNLQYDDLLKSTRKLYIL